MDIHLKSSHRWVVGFQSWIGVASNQLVSPQSHASSMGFFEAGCREWRPSLSATSKNPKKSWPVGKVGHVSPVGYGSIPINTIFRGMNIHKSQLFWCEQKGYKVLTHCQFSLSFPQFSDEKNDLHVDSTLEVFDIDPMSLLRSRLLGSVNFPSEVEEARRRQRRREKNWDNYRALHQFTSIYIILQGFWDPVSSHFQYFNSCRLLFLWIQFPPISRHCSKDPTAQITVQKLHVFVEELVADSPSNAKVIVDHLMLGTSGIAIPRRLRQFSVAGTIGSKWCPAIVNMVDMKRQLLDTSLRLDIKLNMEWYGRKQQKGTFQQQQRGYSRSSNQPLLVYLGYMGGWWGMTGMGFHHWWLILNFCGFRLSGWLEILTLHGLGMGHARGILAYCWGDEHPEGSSSTDVLYWTALTDLDVPCGKFNGLYIYIYYIYIY